MKLILLICIIPVVLFGQEQNVDQTVRNGSIVLGSWSVINMATAGIAVKNANGSDMYFHQMNGYWNTVNGALSAYSLLTPLFVKTKGLSQADAAKRYRKIFLINAGLDVGYMAAGGYLSYSSKTNNISRFEGYGTSLLIQGGFLMVYDLWMAHRMKRWTNNQESHLQFSPTPIGFQLSYRF
jgi:hypothetical protein